MTAKPAIIAAATWWTEKLVSHGTSDYGDSDLNATSRLFGGFRPRKSFNSDQLDAFRAALVNELTNNDRSWLTVNNDYHPDPLLVKAAAAAGFSVDMFDLPMKTVMWISGDSVRVAEGYGAQGVTVWEAELAEVIQAYEDNPECQPSVRSIRPTREYYDAWVAVGYSLSTLDAVIDWARTRRGAIYINGELAEQLRWQLDAADSGVPVRLVVEYDIATHENMAVFDVGDIESAVPNHLAAAVQNLETLRPLLAEAGRA